MANFEGDKISYYYEDATKATEDYYATLEEFIKVLEDFYNGEAKIEWME